MKADFYTAVTRRPVVYRGNPFLIEAGLAYGGELPAEETITLYRYANRVPLQYQQGACAVTRAAISTDWRSYQMQQPKGALPIGPMLLLIHIASVWVPFTSESKEAIAHYDEIVKEMRLALQECGRRVAMFIRKRRREADEAKKRSYIEKYIPHVGIALQEILGFDDKERAKVIGNLTQLLERSRRISMAARKTKGAAGASEKGAQKRAEEIRRRNSALDDVTIGAIRDSAAGVHDRVNKRGKPDLAFPIRSLANVSYAEKKGYFEIGRQKKVRTLTVNTVKTFAQTLRMMALSKELVETNDFATKRDAYYQSQELGARRASTSSPSRDTVMDDIEAMFSVHGVIREQLRFIPDEHGGAVAGELIVLDPDRETGEVERIDCTRFGSGAYSIPSLGRAPLLRDRGEVHPRDRDRRHVPAPAEPQVLEEGELHPGLAWAACPRAPRAASSAGSPTSASIPVYAFVDCDPYGISNIYRTLKVGSGNAAHINQFFCVPQARFLGVTPQDIVDYKLPTHPLKDVDVKRAQGRAQERPLLPGAQALAEGDERSARDGRARRAAGARQVGAQLRDRRVPAPQARPPRAVPAVRVPGSPR